MKLIIKNGRVVATATDGYTGPDTCIAAPEGFDIERMGEYVVSAGLAMLPEPDAREVAKAAREVAVAAITVTTADGNTFDGDEVSQWRMARAIISLQATGTPTTIWVLHDNSVIQASAVELSEALALAGAAQGALWVLP